MQWDTAGFSGSAATVLEIDRCRDTAGCLRGAIDEHGKYSVI